MTDNITKLPDRIAQVIDDMTGPDQKGSDVIIDGRLVPDLSMRNHGDEIEFILDRRYSFTFPKEWAYLAASFAFHAMAIGAGHPSPGSPHKSTKHFATPCINVAEFNPEEGA